MKPLKLLFTFSAILLVASNIAAHEFMVKPIHTDAKVGDKIGLSAMVAHRLMVSEEVEDTNYLSISLFENGKKGSEVSLTVNNQLLTVDGVVTPTKKGGAIIAGHREAMVWSKTTTGWKVGDPKKIKGVLESSKYEKFCKVQLTVDGSDNGYDAVIGDRLEIVPLSSPNSTKPGEEISFKILFDGKPLSANVQAGFDGFSSQNNAYCFTADSDENGVITVPVYRDGLWFVRVSHDAEPKNKELYKKHNIRAIYVFEIK